MKCAILLAAAVAGVCIAVPARAQGTDSTRASSRTVVNHAKGTFDVKVVPIPAYDSTAGSNLGRMSIDKVFHGDIEGTSKGEMLTGMTGVANSAGYVAIERVTGTLNGKKGSFLLQHTGIMSKGAQTLVIIIVPDSGTGELAGIAGNLDLRIADGKHYYDLAYTLNGTP